MDLSVKIRRVLPRPGCSGSPDLTRGGRYRPMKTAALSEFPSTPYTCVHPEESIGCMPLLPRGFSVDDNLTTDGHNEVDARSCGCSRLMALLVWHRRTIYPGQFLTGGTPSAKRGDRDAVPLQYQSPSTVLSPLQRTSSESGFQGGVYGDNMISQKSSSHVSIDLNERSNSWAIRKPRINK